MDAGIAIRLLGPGDERVVQALATHDGPADPDVLLADPRTLMLVAFDGDRAKLLVYELEVVESHRQRGVASALLARLAELARERGVRTGFVLTEPDNAAANALYRGAGGTSDSVTVEWTLSYTDD